MSTRARLQNANDSKSLWNFTLSPGWSQFDAHILRLGLMRYGCGSWRDIGRHFPLKNCGQLNLQTQRLFGQQALAEFQKVHIDPKPIKEANDKIEGFRKNTCLINTGNNVTAKENARRKEKHIKERGIPKELYERIQVPLVLDPPMLRKNVVDDIEKLREMYRCVYDIQLRIQHLAEVEKKAAQGGVQIEIKKTKKKVKSKKKDIAETPVNTSRAKPMNQHAMDDDEAMALALSMSMAQANIKTPAVEKASKRTKKKAKSGKKSSKKKSSKKRGSKKKAGKKRKTCPDDDDAPYMPNNEPQRKRKKEQSKK